MRLVLLHLNRHDHVFVSPSRCVPVCCLGSARRGKAASVLLLHSPPLCHLCKAPCVPGLLSSLFSEGSLVIESPAGLGFTCLPLGDGGAGSGGLHPGAAGLLCWSSMCGSCASPPDWSQLSVLQWELPPGLGKRLRVGEPCTPAREPSGVYIIL